MMGISRENTIVLRETDKKELDDIFAWLNARFIVLSRKLDDATGILGSSGFLHGIKWEFLKSYAMKLDVPFDCVVIDLDKEE